MSAIADLIAREILDSRGNPTVEAEVVLDSGIRRGGDVVKALALGAQAVMIGRAYLYGLMAGGKEGVDRTIEILASQVEQTMKLLQVPTLADLGPQHVTQLSRLTRLGEEGKDVDVYVVGRKAQTYFDFRGRGYKKLWTGQTDAPAAERASEIGETLVDAFLTDTADGGVDEIHVVFTEFVSLVKQNPHVVRLLPLEVVEEEVAAPEDVLPLYEYEPDAEEVLDALLPKYIESRIFNAMLQSAASELANRQRAMKSAGDNASGLIKDYTLLMNNARQAEITQELTELIAGADALNNS